MSTLGRKVRTLRRVAGNIAFGWAEPTGLVLLYHRVTRLADDPQALAVSPEHFRSHLVYLREHFRVVPFAEVGDDLSRRVTSVAITFDDGYADNHAEALPIIESVGVPVTFFVTSGQIGSDREFWWDELDRLILHPEEFPARVAIGEGVERRQWRTQDRAERMALYGDLHRMMLDMRADVRDRTFATIRGWIGAAPAGRLSHRAMRVDELRRLAGSRWCTIGAHTVSHTRLSLLSRSEQQREIDASRMQIEAWTGKPVSCFSYPFGGSDDFNEDSVEICRAAGYRRVAANVPGQLRRGTDRYRTPRHLVRNWPLETFRRRLRWFRYA